jgi:hypothetical protein
MVEFACTRRPVLGTPAMAAEAPRRKTQQANREVHKKILQKRIFGREFSGFPACTRVRESRLRN